jgi:hypothetical protein
MGTKEKAIAVMVAAISLTGCAMASKTCQGYGYAPGTEAHDNCVSQKMDKLSQSFIAAGQQPQPQVIVVQPSYVPRPTTTCRRVNSTVECQ